MQSLMILEKLEALTAQSKTNYPADFKQSLEYLTFGHLEQVIVELLKTKCLPSLPYNTEACSVKI